MLGLPTSSWPEEVLAERNAEEGKSRDWRRAAGRAAASCSVARLCGGRRDRVGRRHQAGDVCHGHQTLRRLRKTRRGTEPVDGVLTLTLYRHITLRKEESYGARS